MKWFLDLTTRAKLFLGFGMIIVLMSIALIAAYNGISGIELSQRNLFENEFKTAVTLKDIRANQNGMTGAAMHMILTDDASVRKLKIQEIKERSDENDKNIKDAADRFKKYPELLSRLKEFDEIRNVFNETREQQTIPLIMAGKIAEAKKIILGIQSERNQQMRAIADDLIAETFKNAQKLLKDSERRAERLVVIFIILGSITTVSAIFMIIILSRIIANPLMEVSGIAERVASGDLSIDISSDGRSDEVGVLRKTFRTMIENLRVVNKEIQEGINVLASSTSEILASTTQVATGMTETATSVSETTATVEEVKQTSLLSSEKSKNVSEGSQKAALVAQQGNDAVTKTVEGINHIKGLMESVAEGIVKLSEQTQTIGEIITAVNDLAQQSNLLSVNAAIEASKAGEQGKGFAVVAQEIKSMADQSKQATEQVRTILTDIQKATSAAVMAAEQVSKAVDAGVKQADESGEAISKLSDTVAEAAQTASQIEASSRQQLAGMEQVALAMENIKQATQQNVAGVKQAEQAAHNLNELGQKLKELVGRYKV